MNNTPATIYHTLRSAEKLRKQLRDQHIALSAMMKDLKRKGIEHGTLHRQEKRPDYFVWYLNRPGRVSPSGERERVYVGPDVPKQPTVLNTIRRIERGKEYDKIARKLRAVESAIQSYANLLLAAVEAGKMECRRW